MTSSTARSWHLHRRHQKASNERHLGRVRTETTWAGSGGHAYFGHLDLVARENVEAARLQVVVKPRKGVKWVTALHHFGLNEDVDALYSAGGGAWSAWVAYEFKF